MKVPYAAATPWVGKHGGVLHMKPGSRDKQYRILISGPELAELKKFTWAMAEAYGLDRRIEKYRGTRAIGFYSWDLDCLEAVTATALRDDHRYPDKLGAEYEAMRNLRARLERLRAQAYKDIEERLRH